MRIAMDDLRRLAHLGLVRLVEDPEGDLILANYTPKATYERSWGEHPLLLACRGLIVAPDGEVVARPFRKFFNLGELPGTSVADLAVRGEPEVSHKLDGSMVTLYYDGRLGRWRFATRGSFASEQAKHAQRIWDGRYKDREQQLHRSGTYLFELVAPWNRIVVAYEHEDLVLIGFVDFEARVEYPYDSVQVMGQQLGLRVVQTESLDWRSLHTLERANFEGFVLYWPEDGLRVKVKLGEYIRLHRIVTGLNEHAVWEALVAGTDEATRRDLPEELLGWFDGVRGRLLGQFQAKRQVISGMVAGIRDGGLDPADRAQRKAIAAEVMMLPHDLRAAAFAHIDGKDWATPLWKGLEPSGREGPPASSALGEEAG